jgi:heat shock protein HslJ
MRSLAVWICLLVPSLNGAEMPFSAAEEEMSKEQAPTQRGEQSDELLNSELLGQWKWVSFHGMDDRSLEVSAPSRYTLEIRADGVTIRADCNRGMGGFDQEGASLSFSEIATTRMACPPDSLGDLYLSHLGYVRSWLIKNGDLYLSLFADGGIMRFHPTAKTGEAAFPPQAGTNQAVEVPASPEDGGPRNWEVTGVSSALNLRDQRSSTAAILTSFRPGTILDNLGCLRAENRIWCDVQELGGGPRGYVVAEFLRQAVSPDGSVAIGPDDSALRAGQDDFDATGRVPCAQDSGQPMTQCDFGVARAGGGYATVVITKPDGAKRAIFFRIGIPTGADTSQADGYGEFRAEKESDLHYIRVGDERYEIPDAVVLGG